MVALGFAVAWVGYATFMWGYCLVRDYDVTVPDLFKSVWPGSVAGTHANQPGSTGTGTSQAPGTTTAGGRG